MGSIHSLAPGAAALALIITLAACGQGTAATPSLTPSAPAPSQAPADPPAETPGASQAPTEVVEIDLPVIARVTADGTEVRTEASADAPLVRAEDVSGTGSTPEVVLGTDSRVIVLLGPLVAEGESWYEVAAADDSELYFAGGWIPGRLLEPEGEVPGFTPIHVVHGQGDGAEVSAQVMVGTPVSVRFAATTMPESDSCEIEVTLLLTDGTPLNLASDEVTGPMVSELTRDQLPGLFQNQAGTVTLQIESDCSFAATMIAP